MYVQYLQKKLVGINDQETKNLILPKNVRRNYFFFTLNKTTRCMHNIKVWLKIFTKLVDFWRGRTETIVK